MKSTLICFLLVVSVFEINSGLLKQNNTPIKCVVRGCACLDSNTATFVKIACPNSSNTCFEQAASSCYQQKDGKCGWDFNKSLMACLDNNNFCARRGCENKHCEKNIVPFDSSVCNNSLKYPKCFDKAPCRVNKKGECEYESKFKLNACLLSHLAPTEAYKF